MILNDVSLNKLLDQLVQPNNNVKVGPCLIDLTLSNSFKELSSYIDLSQTEDIHHNDITNDNYVLEPGEFCLASTNETVNIPNDMCGFVVGRSSIARCGLQIEAAGLIDPGFCGQITLELQNQTKFPIKLKSGIRLCQLVVHTLNAPCEKPYDGKYNNQTGATSSRLWEDNSEKR